MHAQCIFVLGCGVKCTTGAMSARLYLELRVRLENPQATLPPSRAMSTSKILAGGAAAVLAIGGGAAIAHSLLQTPAPATAQAPAAGSTRPVADQSTARRVYDDAKNSVTYVSSTLPQGQATGSGFVVSADGLVVTNHHVIDSATQVTVKVGTDGKERSAQVVADDPSHDLALLKVDTGSEKLPTLSLGDSSTVAVGDSTYAIGNPFGLDHTFTTGIVSALNRDLQSPNGATISGAIQTDAAINPGNSGGPLLDAGGKVIGVNSQIATGNSSGGEGGSVGIGFAIPSNTVRQFLADARAGKDQPDQSGQQDQQQQVDPYGQDQQQVDPYADPYGQDQQQQVDPYADPYGQDQQQQQVDPYGLEI
jgi:putative serine protease PepD